MFSFVDRVFGASDKNAVPASQAYVLGMKWTVRSRAEQNELADLEPMFARSGVANVTLDKVETGMHEVAFWFHVAEPKRAFKALCEMQCVADRMSTLQAAYAERSKMKFSILWPKGSQVHIPEMLR